MSHWGSQAAFLVLAISAIIPGCARRPAPVTLAVHYVVGGGYQAGGIWYYPREDFHYDATGLASVNPGGRSVTADGEVVDGSGMTASHQTLQLPAIVSVTNLENGLQVMVRVNDRGPASSARVIGLSRRASELLGVSGVVAQVRVKTEEGPSLSLRAQLQGGPVLAVATAPRGVVQAETLAPPPGIGQSARGRRGGVTRAASENAVTAEKSVPERLPEVVQRVMATPGSLFIAAGSFGQAQYARQVAARLGAREGRVERVQDGKAERYRVLAGPFTSVAEADAALDRALRAGVTDARIVIE